MPRDLQLDHRQNSQSVSSNGSHRKKLKVTATETSRNSNAEDEDKKTLETTIQKLLDKKKLSADFTHYELQMIWEASVEKLKPLLTLSSTEDIEFLQSLCCDLFLYDDNYRGASTMDELLKKEKYWEEKLRRI